VAGERRGGGRRVGLVVVVGGGGGGSGLGGGEWARGGNGMKLEEREVRRTGKRVFVKRGARARGRGAGGGEEEQEGGAAGEMFPAAGDLENFVSWIWLPAGTAAAVARRGWWVWTRVCFFR
jgi:hypothetical protein